MRDGLMDNWETIYIDRLIIRRTIWQSRVFIAFFDVAKVLCLIFKIFEDIGSKQWDNIKSDLFLVFFLVFSFHLVNSDEIVSKFDNVSRSFLISLI